jgi:hypothetical protein
VGPVQARLLQQGKLECTPLTFGPAVAPTGDATVPSTMSSQLVMSMVVQFRCTRHGIPVLQTTYVDGYGATVWADGVYGLRL